MSESLTNIHQFHYDTITCCSLILIPVSRNAILLIVTLSFVLAIQFANKSH